PTASPVQHTSSLFPALCNGSGSGSEFALVELLSKVRLERTQGETPLEESVAPEASLAAAKVLTGTGTGRGTSLKLEWGMAPSSQQKMASLTGRIRVAPLVGDSTTLLQELKVADPKTLKLMENGSREDEDTLLLDKAIKTCRESAKITAIKAAAAPGPAPASRPSESANSHSDAESIKTKGAS
ncbi:unnamed protein product, partial [Ascophyllum nodosum]